MKHIDLSGMRATRRRFLRAMAAAGAAGVVAPALAAEEEGAIPKPPAAMGDFKLLGTVRPRHAKEIKSSNWSVGAETMDRDFTIYKHWKQYLGPLGAKKARIQSGWAKTEKEAGKYDWEWLDEIVQDMVDQGVEPWCCICYGNPVYKGGGETGLGGGWPTSDEALAAWDRYVAALVGRYQKHIDEWEIWNEPGLRTKDASAPVKYADFMIRTAEIVRKLQPKARILGLSLPGMPLSFAEAALKRLKEKDKINLLDEVTYHPYSTNPDSSYATVAKLRALVKSYAPDAIIRQGENGAPSMRGGYGAITNYDWNEERQAKWALRRLMGDLGRDIPTSYFSICDMQYPNRVNYKGLLKTNPDKTVHHAKHAYFAVQRIMAIFDDGLKRIADFECEAGDKALSGKISAFAYQCAKGNLAVTIWRNDSSPGDTVLTRTDLAIPRAKLQEPVYVDLLNGGVYEIPKDQFAKDGDGLKLKGVPVYDSVVVIAEKVLVPTKTVPSC